MNFGFTRRRREGRNRSQVVVHVVTCLLGMTATMQVTPASAQPVDVSACRMPPGAALAPEKDRQRAIEACSRVIGDAALPASVRSDALLTRAGIYSLLSAIDLKTAVEIDPANSALRKRRGYHYFTIECRRHCRCHAAIRLSAAIRAERGKASDKCRLSC
jgi:hypothetical protein